MITGEGATIIYKCDLCLIPCEKAIKPTPIGRQEVWELCDACKEKMKVKVKDTNEG